MTNRDFYHAICAPPLADIAKSRTLEEFLRALWLVVGEFRHARAISPEAFLQFLRRAGEIPAPPFREEWRGNSRLSKREGFDRWENAILSQIADLHAMEENGQLKLEWKCFGIDAPSGARWYNFSVDAFLECGTVGSIGGWQDGDPGRDYVPGQVAALNEKGEFISRDARDFVPQVDELPDFDWDALVSFLGAGQCYE